MGITKSKDIFSAVSLSGGKDSSCLLILMIEKGLPIDSVLYADTSMEFPEMENHIANLYPLNFAANWKDVQQSAVHPEFVEITFQNLIARSFPFEEYTRCFHQIIAHYGRVEKQEYLMSDPKPLERLLAARREARAAAPARNLPAHLRGLRERKIKLEAQRLLEELRRPAAPNSPDKAHFAAEVSSWFMALSDEKDREKLSRLLPFPSLELTAMEGKNGLYAVIAQSEDRDQPLRSPSILKKLRQGPAAPPARGRAKEPPER